MITPGTAGFSLDVREGLPGADSEPDMRPGEAGCSNASNRADGFRSADLYQPKRRSGGSPSNTSTSFCPVR